MAGRPEPTPLRALIGTKLRAAREQAGLSQVELAARLGCLQPLVADRESGRRGLTEESFAAIAVALGVEPGALWPTLAEVTAVFRVD